ncbi:ComE operon protein 1 [Vibrio thalassae]|uniref:ComE operon protein 1 n=1 Tax=Vibrio thalassae TaxID=1243014 RepID=A0A240EFV2_9VIBR|nr:helix-hairpin-helix domain-containing protein [Vibrio thalassae]SNX47567.1 ComE operon protein 1 [Vibrio thalassae]
MNYLKNIGLTLLLLVTPVGLSYASEAKKLEGIEITVNINEAGAEELAELLKGVGEEKAKDIVEYRTQHGHFNSADDLTQVKGIGAATVEKNRSRIML